MEVTFLQVRLHWIQSLMSGVVVIKVSLKEVECYIPRMK